MARVLTIGSEAKDLLAVAIDAALVVVGADEERSVRVQVTIAELVDVLVGGDQLADEEEVGERETQREDAKESGEEEDSNGPGVETVGSE